MKEIEFKSGIYVMEIKDENSSFIGYIKKFRKRPLGYSYEITKDIFKAYRWKNFVACQSFYFTFIVNRIKFYELSEYKFQGIEVDVDIKLKRKIKLKRIEKLKPWYKKD